MLRSSLRRCNEPACWTSNRAPALPNTSRRRAYGIVAAQRLRDAFPAALSFAAAASSCAAFRGASCRKNTVARSASTEPRPLPKPSVAPCISTVFWWNRRFSCPLLAARHYPTLAMHRFTKDSDGYAKQRRCFVTVASDKTYPLRPARIGSFSIPRIDWVPDVRRWETFHARIKIQLAAKFWSRRHAIPGRVQRDALKFLTIYRSLRW